MDYIIIHNYNYNYNSGQNRDVLLLLLLRQKEKEREHIHAKKIVTLIIILQNWERNFFRNRIFGRVSFQNERPPDLPSLTYWKTLFTPPARTRTLSSLQTPDPPPPSRLSLVVANCCCRRRAARCRRKHAYWLRFLFNAPSSLPNVPYKAVSIVLGYVSSAPDCTPPLLYRERYMNSQ